MAKDGKLGLRSTSSRVNKVIQEQERSELDKKKDKEKVEKILEALHEETTKKLTVRIPISLHRIAKAKVALDDSSLNEYIINLLKDDLVNETRLPYI